MSNPSVEHAKKAERVIDGKGIPKKRFGVQQIIAAKKPQVDEQSSEGDQSVVAEQSSKISNVNGQKSIPQKHPGIWDILAAKKPKEDEQSKLTEAEQRKMDLQALHDSHHDRKVVSEKDIGRSNACYSAEMDALRKKHPSLCLQDLHEMWRFNKFSVLIEGSLGREQSPKVAEKQELSFQQFDEQLAYLRNELTSLKTAKEDIEEKKQAENNDLKKELEELKKKHEETLIKLTVAEDVAQRDHALEQKLVMLAEAVLVAKRGNEASFKDLKNRVKRIDDELESVPSKLWKMMEELEATHELMDQHTKTELARRKAQFKYMMATRHLVLAKQNEQDESQRNGKKAGGASDPSMDEIAGFKEQLEAQNLEIKQLQKALKDKAEELRFSMEQEKCYKEKLSKASTMLSTLFCWFFAVIIFKLILQFLFH